MSDREIAAKRLTPIFLSFISLKTFILVSNNILVKKVDLGIV